MFLLILTLFISITLVFAVTFSIFCNNDEEKENTIWGFCIISIIVAFFSKILSTVLLSSLFLCALSSYIFGNYRNREKQITLLILAFILIIIWFGFVVGLKIFAASVAFIICFYIFRIFYKILLKFKHVESENELPKCKIYGGTDSFLNNQYEPTADKSDTKSDNMQKSLWDEVGKYWDRGDCYSSQKEKNSFVGRLYELCVGEYLYQRGYAVSFNGAMKGVKDGGIDLIARNEPANLILLVQCKCWSAKREIHDDVLRQLYGSIEVFRRNYRFRTFRNFSFRGILVSTKNNVSHDFLNTANLLGIEYQCIPLRNRFPIVKFCPYGYLGKRLYFPWDENYDSVELTENVLLFQDMNSYQQYIEKGKADGDKISFFGKLASSANIMEPCHLQENQKQHIYEVLEHNNKGEVPATSLTRICCIDFETANSFRCSACSVGIAIIDGEQIIRAEGKLLKPHEQYNTFHPRNIEVHGIRPHNVFFAPEFDKIAPWFFEAMDNALVVAHNAAFDMSVLQKVCELYDIDYSPITYFCTYLAAKRVWKNASSYKLDALCARIGYRFKHHNAGADAKAAGVLLLQMMKVMDSVSPFELASKINMTLGELDGDTHIKCSLDKF